VTTDAVAAARALVAKALAISIDRIGPEAKLYDVAAWDSLGQLSVILAIEERLDAQITDEATFETLTSIVGIAAYLASARTARPGSS
jgi:acyl carrier protein